MGHIPKGYAILLALTSALAGATSLEGQVLAPGNKPLAGARVFAEQGLTGPLHETHTNRQGRFHFDNLPPGMTGVFAIADGYAFAGLTINVPTSNGIAGLTIPLRPAEAIAGQIVDQKKKPVSGARITRFVLLDEPQPALPGARNKVGIPIAKLDSVGFHVPLSSKQGRFRLPQLPEGCTIAIKVAHPSFAQEALAGLQAGQTDITVLMNPGVIVKGAVLTRDTKTPVANATISIRSDQPPYDTSLAKSDGLGNFLVRLKPGVYACQATSPSLRSPGWSKLTVTGDQSSHNLQVFVSRAGQIKGRVADAVSGKPIPGARITLDSYGNPAAIAYTDIDGRYVMDASEGDNLVTMAFAQGFLPPERNPLRLTLSAGESFEVPTFWLMPLPKYAITILDEAMEPVPDAIVTSLRPAQFGWRATDAAGVAPLEFGALPKDGRVLGFAQHPAKPLAALFALTPKDSPMAKAQLLPLARVQGKLVSKKRKAPSGVIVSLAFAKDPLDTSLLIARTVTHPDGSYEFPAVVPGINYRCLVQSTQGPVTASLPFQARPGQTHALEDISIQDLDAPSSLYGAPLPWKSLLPAGKTSDEGAMTVVLCCGQDQASMVIEGLTQAARHLKGHNIRFAAVIDGPIPSTGHSIPVLTGSAPGLATTYVANAEGTIVLETFGLPPLAALQQTGKSP